MKNKFVPTTIEVIDEWIVSDPTRSTQTLLLKSLYDLQAEFLFSQYEPTKAAIEDAGISFWRRLNRWVSSFEDPEDQWTAFRTLEYFFFAGQQETDELYRCAVRNQLYPWLSDQADLNIFNSDFDSKLKKKISACWPCPVTDSLRINSLLHRTGLEGQDLRPDWYSLKTLGDAKKIGQFVRKKGIRYLALFEDFVGSGTQAEKAAAFALEVFHGPVFLCPLVICNPGDRKLRELEKKSGGRVFYSPVVVLGEDCLVSENPSATEPGSFSDLRIAMKRGYKTAKLNLKDEEFGFGKVGALFSSYSNCPNNTPPIFHARSNTWASPIFPRKRRL